MVKKKRDDFPKYRCHRADKPIVIDGILDEPGWKEVEHPEFFVPITLASPVSRTEAGILYDGEFLYFGFKAFDRDIRATFTERDSHTWREDVVEVFLKPGENSEGYFEFQFSPLCTIFDAYLTGSKPVNRVLEYAKWDCENIKASARIKGTLNDSSDMDEYWTLEAAIPFKSLPGSGGKSPGKDDKWLFHLARYDYSAYIRSGRELSSTARFSEFNFHHIDDWMTLEFE